MHAQLEQAQLEVVQLKSVQLEDAHAGVVKRTATSSGEIMPRCDGAQQLSLSGLTGTRPGVILQRAGKAARESK